MTVQDAPTWSFGGRSVMGAAHVRHGVPNQDAIAWAPRAGSAASAVLALADGHGAAPHFRSGIGAHIAVEAATAVLSDALGRPDWIAARDSLRADAVAREIVARWKAAVRDHVAANPLGAAGDPYLPYGATLVAAAVAPEGIFLLQLGDGDVLLGAADGAMLRPLPDDAGMIGQQTYSLCLPEAETLVRTRILTGRDADIDFIMLSTDGLAKSFRSDGAFRRHADCWRTLLTLTELPEVCDRLDRWLSSASRHGSGDDMTLGFMTRSAPTEGTRTASWLRTRMARARISAQGRGFSRLTTGSRVLFPGMGIPLAALILTLTAAVGYFLARWIF